jgi:hypothetical protein
METAPGKVPRVVDWRLEPVQIPVSVLPAFQGRRPTAASVEVLARAQPHGIA